MESVNNKINNDNNFNLIQWNVLASGEFFCNPSSFPHVDKKFLTWDYRKNLFRNVIRKLNADIFCLEEVDNYESFQNEIFDDLLITYSSVFYSKNSGGQGVALFYKKDLFELLNSFKLHLKGDDSEEKLTNQFFSINFLKHRQLNKVFCVLITHLKAKKPFEEVRKNQIKHICKTVNEDKEFINLYKSFNCESIILCGDFNTEPECESIQYLKNFEFTDASLKKFNSAYNIFDKEKDDYLECTTFKIREEEAYRVIDYIFYAGKIKVNQIEKIPTKSSKEWEAIREIGLPSSFFPSDHHFIGANFEFI